MGNQRNAERIRERKERNRLARLEAETGNNPDSELAVIPPARKPIRPRPVYTTESDENPSFSFDNSASGDDSNPAQDNAVDDETMEAAKTLASVSGFPAPAPSSVDDDDLEEWVNDDEEEEIDQLDPSSDPVPEESDGASAVAREAVARLFVHHAKLVARANPHPLESHRRWVGEAIVVVVGGTQRVQRWRLSHQTLTRMKSSVLFLAMQFSGVDTGLVFLSEDVLSSEISFSVPYDGATEQITLSSDTDFKEFKKALAKITHKHRDELRYGYRFSTDARTTPLSHLRTDNHFSQTMKCACAAMAEHNGSRTTGRKSKPKKAFAVELSELKTPADMKKAGLSVVPFRLYIDVKHLARSWEAFGAQQFRLWHR